MSRWLDLARKADTKANPSVDNQTKHDKSPSAHPQVAFCQVLSGCQVGVREFDDTLDAAEERAAIIEFDGGLSRSEAEALALRQHGGDILAALNRDDLSTDNLNFALMRRLTRDEEQT